MLISVSMLGCCVLSEVRPLQFIYLSYKLFFGKRILSDSKKKEKKVSFGVLRTKVVLKFSVGLQKKKKKVQVLKIFFVRVIQTTTVSYIVAVVEPQT